MESSTGATICLPSVVSVAAVVAPSSRRDNRTDGMAGWRNVRWVARRKDGAAVTMDAGPSEAGGCPLTAEAWAGAGPSCEPAGRDRRAAAWSVSSPAPAVAVAVSPSDTASDSDSDPESGEKGPLLSDEADDVA